MLTVPGDVGSAAVDRKLRASISAAPVTHRTVDGDVVAQAAELIGGSGAITILAGLGARDARDELLELAGRLQAPIVATLKAKEFLITKRTTTQTGRGVLCPDA